METQQVSIRIPKYLIQAIDIKRQDYKVSRTTAIINALRKEYQDDEVNLDSGRELKPSNLDNWPEIGRTRQQIADDFTIALREMKAGKGRPIEELISELEQMDVDDAPSGS